MINSAILGLVAVFLFLGGFTIGGIVTEKQWHKTVAHTPCAEFSQETGEFEWVIILDPKIEGGK